MSAERAQPTSGATGSPAAATPAGDRCCTRRRSPSGSVGWSPSTRRTWSSRRDRSSASSGPTAPARRRSSTSSPASSTRPRARSSSAAAGWSRDPERGWLEPFFWVAPGRPRRSSSAALLWQAIDAANIEIGLLMVTIALGVLIVGLLTGDRPAALVRPAPGPRRGLQERPPERHGAGRDRPDVPEHPAVPEHDRARERARGHARRSSAATSWMRLVSTRRQAARGGGRSASAAASCWRSSACRAGTTSPRATCPTATSDASRSRAPSPATRSCCCSTSRPRA